MEGDCRVASHTGIYRFFAARNASRHVLTIFGPLDVVCEVYKLDAQGILRKKSTTIGFSITALSQGGDVGQLQMKEALSQAQQSVGQMVAAPSVLDNVETIVGISAGIADTVKSVSDTWDSLLNKIDLFTQVVGQLSEV